MNTKQLLAAQKDGAKILRNGVEVTYSPRGKSDKKPWLYSNALVQVRYAAAQCQAYKKEEK